MNRGIPGRAKSAVRSILDAELALLSTRGFAYAAHMSEGKDRRRADRRSTPQRGAARERHWRSLLTASTEWATPTGIATVLAGVGVTGYAALRLAASRFYSPLGVSPDDLGLTYRTVLSQFIWGLIYLTLWTLASCLAASGAFCLFRRLPRVAGITLLLSARLTTSG